MVPADPFVVPADAGISADDPSGKRKERVRLPSAGATAGRPRSRIVIVEDLVALVIGIALLAYLAYALARPERF